MNNFYELLGIGPDSTADEIRRAYREKAQQAMWDRPQFAVLSEAFETLKDPARRAGYDIQWRAATGREAEVAGSKDEAVTAMETQATMARGAVAYNMVSGPEMSDRTQGVILPPCPVCTTPGVPGEMFCPECGFLVGSTPGVAAPDRPLPRLVDARGREFALKLGENTVGREGADVMLPDRTVSRLHAVLTVDPSGDVWVEDTGSTNGTQRAGKPLSAGQRAALADGTKLEFGAVKLTIQIPDAPRALPLPEVTPTREPIGALSAPDGTEDAVAKFIGANGTVYPLTQTTMTFGRRPSNDFVLNGDPFVSGAHAQITFENGAFQLVDVGSTNGSQINGRKVTAHIPERLTDGDEVILGQTPVTFHGRVEDAGEEAAS